jgi:replicative DNA helicase
MDFERKLVNAVVQRSNVESLLLSGIKEEHFSEEENREIFTFMTEHFRKYKTSPSAEIVSNAFPDHLFETEQDTLQYLKDEFLKVVKRRYAMIAIHELADALEDGELVGDIDALFLEKSRELSQIVPVAELSRFKDMDKRIVAYESGEDILDGILMGIPDFDFVTSGIQSHEYVTISGFSGTGKSTLAQWMLFNAYMQGKTPMYISLEMEAKALLRKWDTMAMNFEYQRLKRQRLSDEDLLRWKERAEIVREADNDIIILDDVAGCTVDRVYAELTRYQPDILCIDYITLMDTPRSAGGTQMWEKVVTLTRQLKQTSRTLGIPIIGVAQTNRSGYQTGAQLDNIAFSQSIVNDSDIILGLAARDEEMERNKRQTIRLLKNRDGRVKESDLLWKMETMEFGPWKDHYAFE